MWCRAMLPPLCRKQDMATIRNTGLFALRGSSAASSWQDRAWRSWAASKYANAQVCECSSMRTPKYANAQVCECPSMRMSKYANVQVCECPSMRMPKYANVQVCECPSMRIHIILIITMIIITWSFAYMGIRIFWHSHT